ncbi:hypothetical protein [Bifidobacterium dentium]|uniref:hypothetical protein n=1 Tax=Bifidobacterium dentium TaxID=1689 RepID=UPI0018B09DBB|nr:hypothetical protein [Bifidobacterium dentium]MBF9690636.1 hypothetical protein [Bifidobacterium dentium]
MCTSIGIGDWATWASAVIAVVSAVVSVWWPHRNRRQAGWFIVDHDDVEQAMLTHGLASWRPHNGRVVPDRLFEVLNDGDGDGFNVSFTVDGGEATIVTVQDDGIDHAVTELPNVHVVAPGEKVLVVVWIDSDVAALVIHWTLQPTRLDRRVYHRIGVRGKIDRQPWKPLPEPEHDRGMNLTLYRLTHFRETRLAHRLSRWKRNLISLLRRRR